MRLPKHFALVSDDTYQKIWSNNQYHEHNVKCHDTVDFPMIASDSGRSWKHTWEQDFFLIKPFGELDQIWSQFFCTFVNFQAAAWVNTTRAYVLHGLVWGQWGKQIYITITVKQLENYDTGGLTRVSLWIVSVDNERSTFHIVYNSWSWAVWIYEVRKCKNVYLYLITHRQCCSLLGIYSLLRHHL